MPLTKRVAELVPDFFESRSPVRHQHRCASSGCAPTDELKDTLSGWFATGKFLGVHEEIFPSNVPGATGIPPNKALKEEAYKASKKKDRPAHEDFTSFAACHHPPQDQWLL